MKWRAAIAAILPCVIGLARVPVNARAADNEEDPAAAQFFRAGLAAYERHEFKAAALAFEEADRRIPRAAAMYNAGRAWQAAGDAARAADAFAAALAGVDLEASDASRAKKGLDELEPSLGKVAVTGPTTATLFFDESERRNLPRTVHARPGAHDVRVRRRDGSDVTSHLIVVVGQTESVAVEDVPISPDAQSGGATATVPPAIPPKNNALRTWGYVSLGSTAALGIAGVATYLEFSSTRSTFDAGGDAVGSLHSTAAAYRTATYALWGLGLACGVTGVVLLAIPNSRSSRTMGFGIGPGAAFFRGSF